MKKILLGIFATMTILSSMQTFAAESLVQKVYKIESYKWDEMNNNYAYLGHGSAVLIGDNKIITNAHVVLDENNIPTGDYNLCISEEFETTPKCKTSLKLIQYDETNDLALLEPIEKISLGTPVQSSTRKLTLGEIAQVYGYPENGGDTITLTEGKVSGANNNRYKIDANIDAGNSGGGAFDKDGKFIGIPYIASIGYSTLGYIIPVSVINDFLAGTGDITKYGKTEAGFLKHIKNIDAKILTQKVDNAFFSFDGFDKKGFMLEGVSELPENTIGSYSLYSKSKNTYIAVWNGEIYGKNYISHVANIPKLKELYETVLERKDVTIGGKKIKDMVALIGLKQDDGTVNKNVVSLIFDLGNVGYMITTTNYSSEKKSVNAALTLFVRNLKMKQELSTKDIEAFKNIAGTFKIIPNMNIVHSYAGTTFHFNSTTPQQGMITIEKTYDTEGESLKDYTFEEKMEAYLYDGQEMEIKKNSQGTYYTDEVTTEKNGEKSISNFLYTKVGNVIYSVTVMFTIPKSDTELEKQYYQFLDTITLTGEFPFKSATLGKVISKPTDTTESTK